MSKKLTISIPDSLHIRLEGFRKKFSISGVCSKALKEEMDGRDDCVNEAKKRLQLLTNSEKCSLAYENGRQWAGYEASIEEMATVCLWEYNDEDASKLVYALADTHKGINNQLSGWSNVLELVMHSYMDKTVLRESDSNFFFENHEAAMDFISGVKEVWWEIQNEAMQELLNPK